ncbi:hypothetical protein PoB_005900500 [Plakobranchus ocellatus]|uniref:Uncharacterized protein n=1 Tax=Plakobranchus ocellatus TaxID=259542 RepID=A0AAV4CI32_9GAST|nr:hypothetical protein PoB_005900500 [Plakobranchus ocellatus]
MTAHVSGKPSAIFRPVMAQQRYFRVDMGGATCGVNKFFASTSPYADSFSWPSGKDLTIDASQSVLPALGDSNDPMMRREVW